MTCSGPKLRRHDGRITSMIRTAEAFTHALERPKILGRCADEPWPNDLLIV